VDEDYYPQTQPPPGVSEGDEAESGGDH
jgi:hypothetical protein